MKSLTSKQAKYVAALIGLDILLFSLTDATSVPSFIVIIGFGLLALTLYCFIYGLAGLAGLYGITIKRKKAFSLYMTSVVSGLVALQSVGQLGAKDILVLVPLVVIAYFYSAYAKRAGV